VLPENFAVVEPEATIVQFVLGTEAQSMHFSELLLGDTDFSEIAKVSVGGRAEEFFKAMCLLEGKADEKFDRICQTINARLVKIVGREIRKRQKSKTESTIKVTMWRQIMEYLQSPRFAKLVKSNPGAALKSHAGMVVVVITLTRLLNEKIRIGMVAGSKRLQGAPQTQVMIDAKREVNNFFGWAIFQVYDVYRDKQRSELTDDDEMKDADNHVLYLRTMRVLHKDVIGDTDYLENCYSDHLQLENNGGLTLLSRKYFDFGTFLMSIIANAFTQAHIVNEGNESWTKGMARVNTQFEAIKQRFLALGEDFEQLETSAKVRVLERLVRKTAHARHGVELKIYKENTVKRKGKNYVGSTHRGKLSVLSKGSETSSLPKEAMVKRDKK
jgi:hypothetical protein